MSASVLHAKLKVEIGVDLLGIALNDDRVVQEAMAASLDVVETDAFVLVVAICAHFDVGFDQSGL